MGLYPDGRQDPEIDANPLFSSQRWSNAKGGANNINHVVDCGPLSWPTASSSPGVLQSQVPSPRWTWVLSPAMAATNLRHRVGLWSPDRQNLASAGFATGFTQSTPCAIGLALQLAGTILLMKTFHQGTPLAIIWLYTHYDRTGDR